MSHYYPQSGSIPQSSSSSTSEVSTDLEESLSRRIRSSREEYEGLRRENAFNDNEVKHMGDEVRVIEDEERQLRMSFEILESTLDSLQEEVREVIQSRHESDARVKALQREANLLIINDEASQLMTAGQECFLSFLQHFKKTSEVNNNHNSSSGILTNSESRSQGGNDDSESVFKEEYDALQDLLSQVDHQIHSLATKNDEVSDGITSNLPSEERLNDLRQEKSKLSLENLELEREYETLKLRTGKRGGLFGK